MAPVSTQLDGIALAHGTYVIGDIHGRLDLLDKLLEMIDADVEQNGYSQPRLVFVGDYIDRGEQSAGVLKRLHALSAQWPENITCLMGNHEAMLLSFLQDPAAKGARWLRFGGLQTLSSFKVRLRGIGEAPNRSDLMSAASQLFENMTDLLPWLQRLPLSWSDGNFWVTHAAADPSLPMSEQPKRSLLWGHPEFGKRRRGDGVWVAHGHTIVPEPCLNNGVISIDTGAVYSNRLTAAAVAPNGEVRFLQTSG